MIEVKKFGHRLVVDEVMNDDDLTEITALLGSTCNRNLAFRLYEPLYKAVTEAGLEVESQYDRYVDGL